MRTFPNSLSLLAGLSLAGCQALDKSSANEAVFARIIEAHRTFGSTPRDWPNHEFRTQDIRPVVILAPLFSPHTLAPFVKKVTQVADGRFPVYDIETKQGQYASFVRVGVGACNTLDAVLALSDTPCRTLLFVGSVGSLTEEASIGDIIIPPESVSGCGADLYLTTRSFLKERLGRTFQADSDCQAQLLATAQKEVGNQVRVQDLKVVSVDTVIGEYHHLNEIKNLGCSAIEMETATFFHAARVTGKKAAALLYVADCTFQGQSLYHGRTANLKAKKKMVKQTLLPRILLNFVNNCKGQAH